MAQQVTIWVRNSGMKESDETQLLTDFAEKIREEYPKHDVLYLVEEVETYTEDDDTVRVWITEHDDEDVQYVINDEDDMRGNYQDMVDEQVSSFPTTFESYLNSWRSFDMPRHIFDSPDQHDRIDWIDLNK